MDRGSSYLRGERFHGVNLPGAGVRLASRVAASLVPLRRVHGHHIFQGSLLPLVLGSSMDTIHATFEFTHLISYILLWVKILSLPGKYTVHLEQWAEWRRCA